MIFNVSLNLALFPEYFWDEGVYIERVTSFLKTFQMYQHSDYIDHPPLGWIIPSLPLSLIRFPDSITHLQIHDISFKIQLLFIIPRLVAISYVILIAILIYKLSEQLYNNKRIALISLATFASIPALWPFRNLLLDPLMILFVLSSLFLITSRKYGKNNSRIDYMSFLSGMLFGCALLTKFSAIFFLPALLFRIMQSKNKLRIGITWLTPLIAIIVSWVFVLSNQHDLGGLLSTQMWQVSRISELPYGIALQILFTASPIGITFGIFGIMQLAKKKDTSSLFLSVPYLGFLFRGGFVGFVHVIPILPILSIYAGKPLYDLIQKISKIQSMQENDKSFNLLLITILVFSVSMTIWITSFDTGKAQREAIEYLSDTLPSNTVLVTNPGYGWIVEQFRPDIQVTDFFSFNFIKKIPDEVYFAENTSPVRRDQSLSHAQAIYEKSCLVNVFKTEPLFFHPYSMPSDFPWNVNIRHFSIRGC
jgi:4-amino-4-deoxy-L-arabinose transferase-like glycosyltransferase